jgi:hypothetical protein
MYIIFQNENVEERYYLEDLGLDGKMNRKEIQWEDVEWIHLAQDWDQWRAAT